MAYRDVLDRADRVSRRAELLTDVAFEEARQRIHERADAVRADRREQQEMWRENRRQNAEIQSEYDAIFRQLGVQAEPPRISEPSADYDRRMLADAQRLLPSDHDTRKFRADSIHESAFPEVRRQVFAGLAQEIARPSGDNLPIDCFDPRARREVIDPATNLKKVEFNAKESFIKGLNRVGQKVACFWKDGRPLSINRIPLRWPQVRD
jgi:hypothetical protein